MAEKIGKINTEPMQDMDDFIIDQLRESPELIPDLLDIISILNIATI